MWPTSSFLDTTDSELAFTVNVIVNSVVNGRAHRLRQKIPSLPSTRFVGSASPNYGTYPKWRHFLLKLLPALTTATLDTQLQVTRRTTADCHCSSISNRGAGGGPRMFFNVFSRGKMEPISLASCRVSNSRSRCLISLVILHLFPLYHHFQLVHGKQYTHQHLYSSPFKPKDQLRPIN